jgi:predicted GTPase
MLWIRDCATLVVKERELYSLYQNLGIKPKLVITDSQEFSKVAADLPSDQALTSFSILFARKKGDMSQFIQGLSEQWKGFKGQSQGA